jgi:primosomal protein N' (replication factor Y) (superfamily II helicase)
MNSHPMRVQVALPLSIEGPLTYLWPEGAAVSPAVGWRVLVPLGRRRVTGYVVQAVPAPSRSAEAGQESSALRSILSFQDDEPIFGPKELPFYHWISQYYLVPLGEVLRTALPGSMNVRSHRGVRILPQGLLALKHGLFLTRQEAVILSHLARPGQMALRTLQQRAGRSVHRAVRSLESKGFVEDCQLLKGKKAARIAEQALVNLSLPPSCPPPEEWVSLLPEDESRILKYLSHQGPCSARDLKETLAASDRALSTLALKGLIRYRKEEAPPGASARFPEAVELPPTLTTQQKEAVNRIRPFVDQGQFHSFLLHGITSSGKTEVYLEVIDSALRKGRDAIVLVPEISLTPQTLRRFSSRFGTHIAVLHSRLTERERLDFWWKIRRGQARIVIGARSAVFAPFQNLGAIVVDEEHDPSYKQQDRVRYNARDLALVRGQRERAVVILGSATPSLESYYNVQRGKSTLLELTERIQGRPLPEIRQIDMRHPASLRLARSSLSLPLQQALVQNWEQGKKSLVFLNRRGYAHTLVCRDCGHLVRCPHCSVSLTLHRARKRLCCHYCEYERFIPSSCPSCRGLDVQPVGKGTERIEEEISALLPRARIGRMDRDTTRRRGAHERILTQFRGEDLDILIGTQMIAKGHDIPEITLVGVVLADVSLDLPDFRASERTLQLLMQVAGRAGRGRWPGRVLVQSYHPDHYCIESACHHDYRRFYEQEIACREELGYPPFCRIVNLRLTGKDEQATQKAARRMGEIAQSVQQENASQYRAIEILGPSLAPLARLRDRFRYHCFLKGRAAKTVLSFAREIISRRKAFLPSTKVQLEVDVDPVQVL